MFSKESFLIFLDMEPCTFHPQPQKFFPKKTAPKKFLIFSPKKSLIFWKRKSRQNPYISVNGTFLYFRRWNFFILHETKLYISGKVYSEPQHIQNYGIFRTRGIFKTMSNIYDRTFCNSYLARLKKILIFSRNESFQLQY